MKKITQQINQIKYSTHIINISKIAIPKWYKEYEKGNIDKHKSFEIAQETSPMGILDKYFNQPDIYITFSDVKRFGFNPRYSFNTPFGIYAYPFDIKWAIDPPSFATERNYMHIFRVIGNTLDTSKYAEANFQEDIKKLNSFFPINSFYSLLEYAKNGAREKTPAGILWNFTRILSNSENLKINHDVKNWSKILSVLDYSCIKDYSGIIHPAEKTQAVIVTASDLFPVEYINTLNNKKIIVKKQKVGDKITVIEHGDNLDKNNFSLKSKFIKRFNNDQSKKNDIKNALKELRLIRGEILSDVFNGLYLPEDKDKIINIIKNDPAIYSVLDINFADKDQANLAIEIFLNTDKDFQKLLPDVSDIWFKPLIENIPPEEVNRLFISLFKKSNYLYIEFLPQNFPDFEELILHLYLSGEDSAKYALNSNFPSHRKLLIQAIKQYPKDKKLYKNFDIKYKEFYEVATELDLDIQAFISYRQENNYLQIPYLIINRIKNKNEMFLLPILNNYYQSFSQKFIIDEIINGNISLYDFISQNENFYFDYEMINKIKKHFDNIPKDIQNKIFPYILNNLRLERNESDISFLEKFLKTKTTKEYDDAISKKLSNTGPTGYNQNLFILASNIPEVYKQLFDIARTYKSYNNLEKLPAILNFFQQKAEQGDENAITLLYDQNCSYIRSDLIDKKYHLMIKMLSPLIEQSKIRYESLKEQDIDYIKNNLNEILEENKYFLYQHINQITQYIDDNFINPYMHPYYYDLFILPFKDDYIKLKKTLYEQMNDLCEMKNAFSFIRNYKFLLNYLNDAAELIYFNIKKLKNNQL